MCNFRNATAGPSTSFGAESAPNSTQDDSSFLVRTSDSEHETVETVCSTLVLVNLPVTRTDSDAGSEDHRLQTETARVKTSGQFNANDLRHEIILAVDGKRHRNQGGLFSPAGAPGAAENHFRGFVFFE